MESLMKCAAMAVMGAIMCLLTKKEAATFGTLVSLSVVLMLAASVLSFLKPVMTFAQSLKDLAGLGTGVMGSVVKALGIGFLTEIGKNICSDAGESAISGVLELLGSVAGIYVLLPLMESVLDLICSML